MPTQVNLDALIPREDFEIIDPPQQFNMTQTLAIRDLEDEAFFYHTLRKPDFQRETADWISQRIMEFVVSFLDGDLIPAIILWNSGSNIFVIDGAHRLSALIAWVSDDYGDGPISQAFFEHKIPKEQLSAAQTTRQLVKKAVGDYKSHKYVIQHSENAPSALLGRARKLGSLALQVQWVSGNANKAENSFFRINQQAVAINTTELNLLKARTMPTAMAARAIIHSGTGHRYWSKFDEVKKKEVEELSTEIYNSLFTPTLQTPIKTLDLPIAGHGYSVQTLQLVYDFINLVNENKEIAEDDSGDGTITLLKAARRVVYRISGNHPSSLGLHPAVYFYGANGRYQPTAFLSIVSLILEWEKREGYFDIFTRHRQQFETYLLGHKSLANQVATVIGSGIRGMGRLRDIFQIIRTFA